MGIFNPIFISYYQEFKAGVDSIGTQASNKNLQEKKRKYLDE